jgi:hypothetical protein
LSADVHDRGAGIDRETENRSPLAQIVVPSQPIN